LRQALAGRFRGHHAFLIGQLLAHLDDLDEAIGILSGQVETVIAPLTPLESIPGINQRTAEVISAETGVDMSAFRSAGHRLVLPGTLMGFPDRGRPRSRGKTRKGNRWLRTALIEAAAGASRVKNSAVQARFRRVLRHRGPKKAVVAVAHALLRAACHVLADHAAYRELGADYYDGSTANASCGARSTSSSARAPA
jgi:transposase